MPPFRASLFILAMQGGISLDITLYYNHSENNVINKDIASAHLFSGTLKDETSITNPVIMIESDATIINYNYARIPDFARYYFITDITSVRYGLWRVTMRCDVLESFADDILASTCILDHSTDTGTNEYLNSETWVSTVRDKTDIIKFSGGLSDSGEYILITAGG